MLQAPKLCIQASHRWQSERHKRKLINIFGMAEMKLFSHCGLPLPSLILTFWKLEWPLKVVFVPEASSLTPPNLQGWIKCTEHEAGVEHSVKLHSPIFMIFLTCMPTGKDLLERDFWGLLEYRLLEPVMWLPCPWPSENPGAPVMIREAAGRSGKEESLCRLNRQANLVVWSSSATV